MPSAYRLDLPGVDSDHADPRGDKLFAQRVGKGADRSLGSAVDAAAGIRFTASNTANVDDITAATLISLLEDRENSLSHVNQAGDVRVEHDIHVLGSNVGCLCNTLDQATDKAIVSTKKMMWLGNDSRIVDKDIDLFELVWQGWNKVLDLLWVADIQLHGQNLDTVTDLLFDLRGDLLQGINAPRSQDQLEVLG